MNDQIEIHLSSATVRRGVRLAAIGLVLSVPIWLLASSFSTPHQFTNGTDANADEVNENFSTVAEAVNDNWQRFIRPLDFANCQNVSSPPSGIADDALTFLECPADALLLACTCMSDDTNCDGSFTESVAPGVLRCTAQSGDNGVPVTARAMCCTFEEEQFPLL
ncbi:MAG: hypothetical protein AAF384_16125 [Pseudomonadota bacterium]